MAKYSATVKGGFFAQYSGSLNSIEPYNYSMDHKRAAQYLAHKSQYEFRQILDTLILSGVGATAALNYSEIDPVSSEMGGKRAIVSTPIINRVVTGNDVSDARETITSLSSDTYTPVPVPNGDHNPLGTR